MGRRLLMLVPTVIMLLAVPSASGQLPATDAALPAIHDYDTIDPCLAPEDLVVVDRVRARIRELDQREEMLVAREQAIDARRAMIDVEERRLEQLRQSVEEMLRQRNEARDSGLDSLVKMVDKMKPAEAADMIVRMDRETAAALLERLGSRQAGKILGAMPPEVAAEIGGLLAADSELLRELEARR